MVSNVLAVGVVVAVVLVDSRKDDMEELTDAMAVVSEIRIFVSCKVTKEAENSSKELTLDMKLVIKAEELDCDCE